MLNSDSLNNSENKDNVYELSQNSINYLSNQFVQVGDKKIIKKRFIFQIVNIIKRLPNWYACSLIDKNSIYDGFFINYDERFGLPKVGDIIETFSIQIVKLPNRDNYIYFCNNIQRIKESQELLKINLRKIINYSNYNENNINIYENKIIKYNNIDNGKINIKFNINQCAKENNKKYTLIQELLTKNSFKDVVFYVKCKTKSSIRDYNNKVEKTKGKLQYYYFLDTEGDLMKVIAFSMPDIEYFGNLIHPRGIYEISKLNFKKEIYDEYHGALPPIRIVFSRYGTKVKQLEDKGDFYKIKEIYEKLNTKICDLNKVKSRSNFNVVGIILECKGNDESTNSENKSINLVIGDTSLHRINVILWSNLKKHEIPLLKGDIIYLTDFFYHENLIFNQLSSASLSHIYICQPSSTEQEYRNFYKNHPNIYEYRDMNLIYLNSKKDIEHKFIRDFKRESPKEENKNDDSKYNLIKLYVTITKIVHKRSNVIIKCNLCNKKIEENHFFNCEGIPKLSFKLGIEIRDCSDSLSIELYGKSAENLLKMTPDEYIQIINDNNIEILKEIDKRILYKNYVFYGRNNTVSKGPFKMFLTYKFDELNNEFYKNLIKGFSSNTD